MVDFWLVTLLSLVSVIHVRTATLEAYGDSQGSIDKALSIDAVGHAKRAGDDTRTPDARSDKFKLVESGVQQRSQMIRSEKSEPDAGKQGEAHSSTSLRARTDLEEQQIIEEMRWVYDGQYISMNTFKAEQSSVMEGGMPSRAIDMNAANEWKDNSCTHTREEGEKECWMQKLGKPCEQSPFPWWKVELEDVYHISAVRTTIRADCCGWLCWECPNLNIDVDWEPCATNVKFRRAEASPVTPCFWVGDVVRVVAQMSRKEKPDEGDYLMLCEVEVKATKQSDIVGFTEMCEKHSVLVRKVNARFGQDGHCIAALSTEGNASKAFPWMTNGDDLHMTSEECQEHLLKGDEMLQGAVWRATPGIGHTSRPVGTCQLLSGHRVVGAHPVPGARCFQKHRCPRDLTQFKARSLLKKSQPIPPWT